MAGSRDVRAGRAFVEILLRDKLSAGLRRAQRKLKMFGSQMRNIGLRVSAFGLALGTPLAFATRTFAAFSDEIAKVRAVTGATEPQFKKLNDTAKELGRTTSFTASEVAGAMTELARAGFQTDEIIASIGAVLNLARATDTELPRAAEIAAAAMRGFQLSAGETVRISDVLAKTANSSAQNLDDLGEAMKFVAPLAFEAGASIESTNAALAVLANNALKGTVAGSALARAYKQLSSTAVDKTLRRLGVAAADSGGNLRPVSTILNEIGQATRRLGSRERLGIFEQLFGRGSAAALKLASPTAQFGELQSAIENSQGTAKKTAKVMDNTLGGAFRRLFSAVEGVQIAFGEAIQGPLSRFNAIVGKIAGFITELIEKNQKLVRSIAMGIAIAIAIGAAMAAAGIAIVVFGAVLGGTATIVSSLAGVIAALLSPLGLVAALVAVVGAAFIKMSGLGATAVEFLMSSFAELKESVTRTMGGIAQALKGGNIQLAARILWLQLKVLWIKSIGGLKQKWSEFTTFFQRVWAEATFGAARQITNAWAGIRKVWVNTVGFLTDVWTVFTTTFRKTWLRVSTWFKGQAIKIKAVFDDTIDVEGEQQKLRDKLNQQLTEADDDQNSRIFESDSQRRNDLADIGQQQVDTLATLDKMLAERHEELSRKQRGAISEAERALAKARQEFEASLREANDLPREVGKKIKENPFKKIADEFAALGTGVRANATTGGSVKGTFSGVVAGLVLNAGINKVDKQQLEELKGINKGVDKLRRKKSTPVFDD